MSCLRGPTSANHKASLPENCKGKRNSVIHGSIILFIYRPAMLYGAECWPTKRRHIQQLSVAEMRMLRWICGHTRRDRVRNDDIRDRLGVASIEESLSNTC